MTSPMSLMPDAPVPGDESRGRLFNLGLLELSRQEAADDGDLVTFSLRKVGAITLVVKSDRFAALLDHRLQHLLDLSFGDALDVGSPAGGHVALIERGQHQTHRRNGARVPRFPRLLEPFGEGLTHRRHASPAVSYKAYPA
jgi:hypothetical protein